jgi:pimeloyl-ACP methyl ester carboxylesterase
MPERFDLQDGSERHPSFDEQFEHPDEVRLPFGTAEVGDLTPEHLKDEVPVYLGHGWGLGLETYKPTMRKLYEHGRRVLSIAHPRYDSALGSSMNAKELTVNPIKPKKRYPKAELRKAFNILEVLEERGIKQVDAIAHSESALNVIYAAMMYPEKFRSIVLFNPAGMMEKENWVRLAKGFAGQGGPRPESLKDMPVTETEREVAAATMRDLKKYLLNPVRGYHEVAAIKKEHYTLADLLPYLQDKFGINIAVMITKDDPVFPHADVERIMKASAVNTYISSIPGGHGRIGDAPEEIIPIVEKQLEEFAKKERTPEQRKAIADREHHAGVRYVPGEGLVISEYIKRGE